jgi:hypothetical protein
MALKSWRVHSAQRLTEYATFVLHKTRCANGPRCWMLACGCYDDDERQGWFGRDRLEMASRIVNATPLFVRGNRSMRAAIIPPPSEAVLPRRLSSRYALPSPTSTPLSTSWGTLSSKKALVLRAYVPMSRMRFFGRLSTRPSPFRKDVLRAYPLRSWRSRS